MLLRATFLVVSAQALLLLTQPADGAIAWGTPAIVGEDDDFESTCVAIGVDWNGAALIAWSAIDPVGFDDDIVYVRVTEEGAEPQKLVHGGNGSMDRIPFMSVGSDGVPWIIWEGYADGYVQLVSRWTGESWSEPDTVFVDGGRYDWYSIYVVDCMDVWVARDSRSAEGDRQISVRRWDGSTWGSEETLGFVGRDDSSPVIGSDGSGGVIVAWLSDVPDRDTVYAARKVMGKWVETAAVDTTRGNIQMCDIDVLPDGRPILTWVGNGYARSTDIEYAVLTDGVWAYGGTVNAPDVLGVDEDWAARFARGPSGELWAFWTSAAVGEPIKEITGAQWLGDGWSAEESVSAADTTELVWDGRPDAAIGPDGGIWVAWARQQSEYPYDKDAFLVRGRTESGASISDLSATTIGPSVFLTWAVSSSAHGGDLQIWRLDGEQEGWVGEGAGIPPGAARIGSVPIGSCEECCFVDSLTLGHETLLYWLENEQGGEVLGPAVVSVSGGSRAGGSIDRISPNPAGESVEFEMSWPASDTASLRLYTVAGRLLREWGLSPSTGSSGVTSRADIRWNIIDRSGSKLPGGVYFAILEDESRRWAAKTKVVVLAH